MTAAGERGLVCQMHVAPNSKEHIRRIPGSRAAEIQRALEPLLERPPAPSFIVQWDEEARVWRSEFAVSNELPAEIRKVFERTGYGCLAAETDIGVVHICHAADRDINGFADKPVWYQWQLIKMPTAPLIRLEVVIMDRPDNPYRFESFLNVAEEDQASVLVQLANQDRLYLAFYGDGLRYRFTKMVPHTEQQWQQLDEISEEARRRWNQIPPPQRDFDFAKTNFIAQAK
jgi:hypothetical protein